LKGRYLCIIEAMKTMNEIRSPRSGVVSAILRGTQPRFPPATRSSLERRNVACRRYSLQTGGRSRSRHSHLQKTRAEGGCGLFGKR
jgi:hypothetical protein